MPNRSWSDELDAATPAAEVDLLLSDLGAPTDLADTSIVDRRDTTRVVLVVDSAPIARKFLVQRLQALGYDAHGAENGERALAMIEYQAYSIVFLELTLQGGIDGLGLCQAIKQAPRPRAGVTPAVVFTTGHPGHSQRVCGSLAGCDAYLHKPLREEALIAALRQVDPLFQ